MQNQGQELPGGWLASLIQRSAVSSQLAAKKKIRNQKIH
jgi:hypothetical protein